ncbi:MAG TPA: hypothetical protein VK184_21040 [Nostocaceae cyanobacterium]|nr:hypothetical protein [Nostocaceae cyanobacterium]
MTENTINLIIPLINKEIEEILATYPQSPYQDVFAHPNYKQMLLAYVLNQVPREYITMIEQKQKRDIQENKLTYLPMEHLLHLESLVHQGIEQILSEQAQDLHQIFGGKVVDPAYLHSNWLG